MARKGNGTSANILSGPGTIVGGVEPYTYHFFYNGATAPGSAVVSQPFTVSTVGGATGTDPSQQDLGFSWSHPAAAFRQAAYQQVSPSTYVSAKLTSVLSAGVWYAIGVTWDSTNLRVYLNGALQATTAAGGLQTNTNFPPHVCALGGAAGTASYDAGTIAEVYYVFGVVSANDMVALSNGAYPRQFEPVDNVGQADALYWPLLGDNPEPDYSVNHRNGIVTGTTVLNHPGVQCFVGLRSS